MWALVYKISSAKHPLSNHLPRLPATVITACFEDEVDNDGYISDL